MTLLIAGSRSIQQFDLSPYIPTETDCIISGGANGIDSLAETYADQHRLSKIILRPQYHLYKRNAPLMRNKKMVELADSVLIIWDGSSKGTKHTMEYAQKLNKPVVLVQINE